MRSWGCSEVSDLVLSVTSTHEVNSVEGLESVDLGVSEVLKLGEVQD